LIVRTSLEPEHTTDAEINPAFISVISTIGPNGGPPREIARTPGLPGRGPVVPTPGNTETPALDVQVFSYDWSPDDTRLALTICANNRWKNGQTSDATCWVELFDPRTGTRIRQFKPGYRPNWSTRNRILYEENDNYGDEPDGIYEVNPAASPPTKQLLVPGTGQQFRPSFYHDSWATWSPDGSRFATIRDVDGLHYDSQDKPVFHKAIMLFNRNELIGRMILLVDHGTEPAGLTWSPDGNFLLYNLSQGDAVDIWWLDVRNGQTGRLTRNGASIAPDWRARCPNPACRDTLGVFLPLIRR
jgi:Tol biopolymer transport system component